MKKNAFLFLFLQISCIGYYTTAENGYRLKNPKNFKFNKPKYTSMDKSAIDTNAIYVMDSIYTKLLDQPIPINRKGNRFVRFFSSGQALFIYNEGIPSLEKVNNKEIGIPAYYIIEGDKIKVNIFQTINGGQTNFYYGQIQKNGDIIFYEENVIALNFPLRILRSYKSLEKAGKESYWTKLKIEKIDNYKPSW